MCQEEICVAIILLPKIINIGSNVLSTVINIIDDKYAFNQDAQTHVIIVGTIIVIIIKVCGR